MYWTETQWGEAKVFEPGWDCLTARGSPWAALVHTVASQEYWAAVELNLECGPRRRVIYVEFWKGATIVSENHWERLERCWLLFQRQAIWTASLLRNPQKMPRGINSVWLSLEPFQHHLGKQPQSIKKKRNIDNGTMPSRQQTLIFERKISQDSRNDNQEAKSHEISQTHSKTKSLQPREQLCEPVQSSALK